MSCEEDQEEEREVLRSIYESDKNFIEINPTTFQYKFGEEGHYKSFLLEIAWPADYPTCLPNIGLDAFYNRHISSTVKESVTDQIKEQCEMCLGCAMTFSIFDWTKEHEEELMTEQHEPDQEVKEEQTPEQERAMQPAKKKEKKEILTKSQKRRIAERTNYKGERERGWNWVDVVKHLSKTGKTD